MKWNEIIGQEQAKGKIDFWVDGFKAGSVCPSIIACGPRGNGKTELMTSTASRLKDASGGIKRAMRYNAASIKNLKGFWDSIIIPVVNDKDVTIFIDEAHKLPEDVTNALLTMTAPNRENRNTYTHDGYTVDVDLYRQTFLYATTEPQKVFIALMNRCRRVDLEDYTPSELATILKRNAPGVTFPTKLITEEIAPTLRGCARDATLMAKDIESYLRPLKRNTFTTEDWAALTKTLSIHKLGLSPLEIRVLESLFENPNCSLTRLGAKLSMTAESVRKDLEIPLLRHGLIEITQGKGRALTAKGHEYLKAMHKANTP